MTAMNWCVLSFESLWMVVNLSHVDCTRLHDLQICARFVVEAAPKSIHVAATTVPDPRFRHGQQGATAGGSERKIFADVFSTVRT